MGPTKMFPTGIGIWFVFVKTSQSSSLVTKLTLRTEKSRPNLLCFIERRTSNITISPQSRITTLKSPSYGLLPNGRKRSNKTTSRLKTPPCQKTTKTCKFVIDIFLSPQTKAIKMVKWPYPQPKRRASVDYDGSIRLGVYLLAFIFF